MTTAMRSAQTVELGGKRFVIVEERHYLKLMRELEAVDRMTKQDWGDVAESKRRLAEKGASIPWQRIKAERSGKASGVSKRGG